jgi:CheY-like chemotaxis protein
MAKIILVVDDDPLQRSLTNTFLSYKNYQVLEAGTAKKALAMLEEHQFAMILTDITLPGVDGVALTKEIRQRYSAAEMPIVILSSYSESQKQKIALDAGANAYLSKPINVQDLFKVIARLLK